MKPLPASDASAGLMKFVDALAGKFVLDAPCGFGRNTIALTQNRCTVVAADRDIARLGATRTTASQAGIASSSIETICCDLSEQSWSSRGFGGQGRNYLDLPAAGYLRRHLDSGFETIAYIERRVGPMAIDAVTVSTFCRRRG
jgi:predicted RNA methylase